MTHSFGYFPRDLLERSGLTGLDFLPALEEVFGLHARGACAMPSPIYFRRRDDQFCNALVTWVPEWGFTSGKLQLGDPDNLKVGRPQVQGLLVLFDDTASLPIALMEAGWVTAMRSVGVSGLFARSLAPSGAETLGLVGAGLQGRLHLDMLPALLPSLKRCVIHDVVPERAAALAEWARASAAIPVEVAGSARDCVSQADVLVTATVITAARQPFIEDGWLRKDCLILALDRDCCFSDGALSSMSAYASDDRRYFDHAKAHEDAFGAIPRLDFDIAELVTGTAPAASRTGRTLTMAIGLPIADLAGAVTVWRKLGHQPQITRLPF